RPSLARAYLAMGAATFFWVTNVIAVKFALQELPQFATLALRVTLASVALGSLRVLQGGRFDLRLLERRNILKLSLCGISLSFFCFTVGLNYTSVSHAVFLNSLVPIAVLVIARIEGLEGITGVQIAGLLLSTAGALSIALDKTGGRGPGLMGDILVVGSA